jgi:hypothetical protein
MHFPRIPKPAPKISEPDARASDSQKPAPAAGALSNWRHMPRPPQQPRLPTEGSPFDRFRKSLPRPPAAAAPSPVTVRQTLRAEPPSKPAPPSRKEAATGEVEFDDEGRRVMTQPIDPPPRPPATYLYQPSPGNVRKPTLHPDDIPW